MKQFVRIRESSGIEMEESRGIEKRNDGEMSHRAGWKASSNIQNASQLFEIHSNNKQQTWLRTIQRHDNTHNNTTQDTFLEVCFI